MRYKSSPIVYIFSFFFLIYSFDSHCINVFNPGPTIKQFDNVNGFPITSIYKITQGHKGFLWLATDNGLLKFNGISFENITHDSNHQQSISSNLILDLWDSDDGYLWLATFGGGLNRFNKMTNTSEHFLNHKRVGKAAKVTGLSANALDSKIYLATNNGLEVFNTKTLLFENSNVLSENQEKRISSSYADKDNIWYAIAGEGLLKYQRSSKKHTHFNNKKVSSSNISKIFKDSKETIWLGTTKGLDKYDSLTNSFIHYQMPISPLNKKNYIFIRNIYEDEQNKLWIATLYNGVVIFDLESEVFSFLTDKYEYLDSLSSLLINDIYQDRSGAIWLATAESGLFKVSKSAMKFQHNILVHKEIEALYTSTNSETYGAFSGELTQLTISKNKYDLLHDFEHKISFISEKDSENLIVGVYGKGLYKFNLSERKASLIEPISSLNAAPNYKRMHSFIGNGNDSYWLGFFGTDGDNYTVGLQYGNFKLNTLDQHLADITVEDIFLLNNDKILVATRHDGLLLYDPINKSSKVLLLDSQSMGTIWTIFKDREGLVWLGTQEAGLILFDQISNELVRVDSLLSKNIRVIQEDAKGHLWLGSSDGLIHYQHKNNTIDNFNKSHGLRFTNFNKGKSTLTSSAHILMTSADDRKLLYFSPKNFTPKLNNSDILLTKFKVLNTNRSQASIENLTQSLEYARLIELEYSDYSFSLSFNSTNFNQQHENKYLYKLEGIDNNWIETTIGQNMVTYSNLNEGLYKFKIKPLDSSIDVSDLMPLISIKIIPPFWRTKLSYFIYILFIFYLYFTCFWGSIYFL
jgi:ligand-binding sensor domain-containing protein